jgi:2'-5' RNA ligase
MAATIRSFIAIELPEVIRTQLQNLQDNLKTCGFKVRWVRPGNIHLTLKFLGNIDEKKMEKVGRTLKARVNQFTPLLLSAKGFGVFPGIRRPRIIWVGLGGQVSSLVALQKMVVKDLETIGYQGEKTPFKAHLTLGRVKGAIDALRLQDAIQTFADFESEIFLADEVFLFKSDLKPGGPVYSKLSAFAMNAS